MGVVEGKWASTVNWSSVPRAGPARHEPGRAILDPVIGTSSEAVRRGALPAACCLLLLALLAPGCGPGTESYPASESSVAGEPRTHRARQMLMGTAFDIQIVGREEAAVQRAMQAAFAEVARVEEPLSEWRETSEISEVNRQAGRGAVTVGPELYAVVERSIRISDLTGGAFDITFAGCGGLWSFREARIPADEALAACLERVDYHRIRLDPERSTLLLPEPGMRIGIAGIGKGYGVDRAAKVIEEHGFADYIVDGGGDIRLKGAKPGGPWKVGIRHPRRSEELFATLTVEAGAIVTSGDYFQFFERDGKRYHHILDPTTGRPARRAVAVTVIAPTAMDADALATGLFVLGPERGLALADAMDGVEALFFGPDLEVRRSDGFPELRPLP
jgi:thiamine biosynthesis lipoprotein